ncbi:acyl-CoA Delta-9 desaturase-like [Euwallacea fornicatus]|uniref:acyl-CoA Delta-9 desaturase-like n=1 Tax=Euwallacea fornicatus TaxID=995702 RepID=UPI00338E6637
MCPTTPNPQTSSSSAQLTCRTTPEAPRNVTDESDENSNSKFGSEVFSEKDNDISRTVKRLAEETKGNSKLRKEIEDFKPTIRWPDLIAQLFIHLGCLYGLFLCVWSAKILTTTFALASVIASGFGITAGAHRLWSHRAYKARWPLRLLLIFLFTISGQRHVYIWALDHRVHHKYSETDADPHNANRGFFFSHVGWLILTPHPLVVEKRKMVDMSDLEQDPIVMWQKRLYPLWFFLIAVLMPVSVPVYFWNETVWNSFWINFNARFCITLNIAFFVNSVAHMWGQKPYDKYISPVENLAVSIAALGEGWHNFHHVFPWDYKTGELGNRWNPSTKFIDFFAKLGWAYELKSVSAQMIARRAKRSGDGSHIWGYGDADIPTEDLKELENMKMEKAAEAKDD